jgi:sulfur carrier protein
MINVIVNGEDREIPANLNLAALLTHLELPSERIAVELNREVVRRAEWDKTAIKDGDKLEIVHFVGGG